MDVRCDDRPKEKPPQLQHPFEIVEAKRFHLESLIRQ
jgi:hypothetical protein